MNPEAPRDADLGLENPPVSFSPGGDLAQTERIAWQ